jgi:hypothetical protein
MTKDNVSVQVDVSIIFRIMGDADKNEDPRNVYNFVHHMAVRGIEEQLQAYQVSVYILIDANSITSQLRLAYHYINFRANIFGPLFVNWIIQSCLGFKDLVNIIM